MSVNKRIQTTDYRHPSLQPPPPGPSGDTEAFPGQLTNIIPPVCPASAPGPHPGGTCLENLYPEVAFSQSARTTSTGSFQHVEAVSLL